MKIMTQNRIVYKLVLFLAIIYTDSYGIATILGGFALINLFGNADCDQNPLERGRKRILVFWLSLLVGFLIMFIFRYTGFNASIAIGNNAIVPSFWLLYFFVVPAIYWFLKRRNAKVHKKNLKLGFAILLLATYKSVIGILNNQASAEAYGGVYAIMSDMFRIIVWAAIMEELFFRAYLYDLAKNIYGRYIAALISSVAFALFHFNVIEKCIALNFMSICNMISIFFLGIFMTVLYEKTKSIMMCIVFHAITDGILLYGYLLIKSFCFC